MGSDLIDSELK